MTPLTHDVLIPADVAPHFAPQRTLRPFDGFRTGFSWCLCPVLVAGAQVWVLISVTVGWVERVEAVSLPSADAVEEAAFTPVDWVLPVEADAEQIGISFHQDDIRWYTADKIPPHVGERYQLAGRALCECRDLAEADVVINRLNAMPLTLHGRTFTPEEGLSGMLHGLMDGYHTYIDQTPKWKQWWHRLTRQDLPWLEPTR